MKYNLCLALFYNKKYSEAFLLFQEIENDLIIKNNSFFWYRYGLTALNLYLINLKKIKKEKEEVKNEYIEKNENIAIKKYSSSNIINEENIKENSYEQELEEDDLFIELEKEFIRSFCSNSINNFNNNSCFNKIIFPVDFSINKEELNDIKKYLLTSIKCFKKSIMLYKRQPLTVQRSTKMINDIKYIMDFYKIEYKNNSNDNNGFYNFNDLKISKISLFSLSYLNLLFCLTLNEKYNEVLLLIKVFLQNF